MGEDQTQLFSPLNPAIQKTKTETRYSPGTSDDGQQLYSEVPLFWRLLAQEQGKAFDYQPFADDIGETKTANETLDKGFEGTLF